MITFSPKNNFFGRFIAWLNDFSLDIQEACFIRRKLTLTEMVRSSKEVFECCKEDASREAALEIWDNAAKNLILSTETISELEKALLLSPSGGKAEETASDYQRPKLLAAVSGE